MRATTKIWYTSGAYEEVTADRPADTQKVIDVFADARESDRVAAVQLTRADGSIAASYKLEG
jgi:hypothetical protein